GRQERGDAADHGAGKPGHLVPDVRRDHQDGSRSELAEREAGDELLRREPVELADYPLLNERDHREAAPEREGAYFEEEEADLREARRRVGCRRSRKRSRRRPRDNMKNEKRRSPGKGGGCGGGGG